MRKDIFTLEKLVFPRGDLGCLASNQHHLFPGTSAACTERSALGAQETDCSFAEGVVLAEEHGVNLDKSTLQKER